MIFSSIGRSITHSARSKFKRNVISGTYNGRNTLLHDSFPPSSTPLGNACVDGCVGILRGYIAYNGAGKQLVSKAYMSNLKSVLGIHRIRRLFSSQGPRKKHYENYYPKNKKQIPKGGEQNSVSKEVSSAVGQGNTQGQFSKQIQDFIASLLLNPHQTKEISFQELKNKLLELGLVDHIEVANKSVAKVYVRSSAREKVHSDDSVSDTVNGSPSEGNVTQFKYYFNIGSVQSFEEKLEEAQEALGIDRHDFVPVIYVSQVMWSKELLRYGPTVLLLGALWFMSRKMPSILVQVEKAAEVYST